MIRRPPQSHCRREQPLSSVRVSISTESQVTTAHDIADAPSTNKHGTMCESLGPGSDGKVPMTLLFLLVLYSNPPGSLLACQPSLPLPSASTSASTVSRALPQRLVHTSYTRLARVSGDAVLRHTPNDNVSFQEGRLIYEETRELQERLVCS